MGTNQESHYNIYVVLVDDYVGTLPSIRRRNPKRDLSKPCVYVGLTPERVGHRFNFRTATGELEWRVRRFGSRLMPELEQLNPMAYEIALQAAKELAEDLRAQGLGVVNDICDEAQSYPSVSRA
jgi:hypothetical protein